MKNSIERALVLSGGGERGAYQVGVCQVLLEMGWQPDMVLGNSIGATNGAMLLAPQGGGSGAALLGAVWRETMLNENMQQVAEAWPPVLAELMGWVIGALQTLQRPPVPADPNVDFGIRRDSRPLEQLFARGNVRERLARRLLESFAELVVEGLQKPSVMARDGWRELLLHNVDFSGLNAADAPYLGIAVTDVATGALRYFWNHVPPGVVGEPSQITVEHVMASSSIPGFYAATQVEGRYWWDGALIANTPLDPAIAAGAQEIIVVLMTPWSDEAEGDGVPWGDEMPSVFDGLNRALDWMMLATFRSTLARLEPEQRARIKIIAPRALQGLVSIVDYGAADNATLIACGKQDAREVLG